ncbi:MAG: amino acid permease, partial [Bacteroidetes bacterium]|nr:amino acid permease [Bacteroidota bacterium]
GDLREPGKSIPWGTLAAVGTGFLIYMGIPVILAGRATPEQLIADPLIMRKMAIWGNAILIGVWGATLSSAVGSILGAPRVLQALARDGVIPNAFRFLGQGSGPNDVPRVGTAFTLAIALATVMLGNLNVVAPILTMFFLTTYGVLNVSAGLERFLGNPSYRPKFRVHWSWSLLGAVGSFGVMFLINPLATWIAIAIVFVIYSWLERRELRSAWGDVRLGLWLNLTRAGLLRMRSAPDSKNWRPHLLVLSGAPTKRWHLIEFASSLTHNRALLTVSSIVPPDKVTTDRIRTMSGSIYDYLDRHGIQALVRIIPAGSPFEGARQLVATYGLGNLVPNSIIVGDSEQLSRREEYCRMIAHFYSAKRNTLIIRYDEARRFGAKRRIDVWWGGIKGNGGLMLILAYLLRTSLEWRGAEVTIKMVVPSADAAAGAARNLDEMVSTSRTGARTEILVADNRPFSEILRSSSSNADLVFIGMATPDGDFTKYYENLQERTRGLPTTVFVLAAENLAFGDVIL